MKHFLRKGDFWSGLALAGFGAYVVATARHWTYMGEDGPGAGFFPMWYGAAMVVLSLLLVAGAVLKPGAGEARTLPWSDLRRALTCWVAFVACIALFKALGFMLAFASLTWFIIAVMYGQSHRKALLVAIGGALVFQMLFGWVLDIQLPAGPFAALLSR
jgi:putative tricarboxylic transport membrane protein